MDPSPYAGAGGGGTGGKIRRRAQSRAAATPYDRPPSAAAARRLAAAADGGGWLSRLVDPASRLIAGGAARLFSTVFRRRLAAPPQPPPPPAAPTEGNTQPRQGIPEATDTGPSPVILERGNEKGNNVASTSDEKPLSEVEHLLMRKTFTRVEFDRLTELLRARTVESDLPPPLVHQEERSEIDASARRDRIDGRVLHGISSDRSVGADVPLGGVSSPADIAKEYMSSRYLRGSPSTTLRSHVLLEDKADPSSSAYVTRRSGSAHVPKSIEHGNENPELSENGHVTPRLHGRSAIYRMSRSPFFKGPSSSNDMNMAPFSLSQTLTHSLHAGGRKALKRRNADLDNELGSVGPIRRIRQKSNMMSPFKDAHASPRRSLLLPGRTNTDVLDVTGGSSSVQESPSLNKLFLGSGQSKRSHEPEENAGDSKYWNGSPAPPQSNRMAEQIFEQLNKIVPSPKGKQSEPESIAGEERCSMVIDPIQGHVSRIMKGPTSSLDPGCSNSLLTKKGKTTEDGSLKAPLSAVKFASQDDSTDAVKSGCGVVTDKPATSGNSNYAATAPSRKPGFKMVVLEDFSEPDDDQDASVPSKNAPSKVEFNSIDKLESKTTEQKFELKASEQKLESKIPEQKVESKILEQKLVNSPKESERHPTSASEVISPSSLISSNRSEENADSTVCADKSIGLTFPLVPSPSAHSEEPPTPIVSVPPPAILTNKNEQTTTPTFTFGLKQSSTSALGTSMAVVKNDTRLSESVANPTLDSSNSNKGTERVKAEGLSKPSSTTCAPSFTFSTSTSPSLSNGFSHSSSPKFSFNAASDVMPPEKSAVSLAPSTTETTFAVSSSSPPIVSALPVFPTFNFGSHASTGSQMASSDKPDGENIEAKPSNSASFGIGSTMAEGKPISPNSASSTSSTLSSLSSFSSSPVTFSSTLSSMATSSVSSNTSSTGASASSTAQSTTFSTMAGLQSATATSFTFSSSGNSTFGFSVPNQSSQDTSAAGSTSQQSTTFGTAPGAIFGSKQPQSESGTLQLSQSSATQFSSPFPTMTFGAGTSSSGSAPVTFGAGTSSSGSAPVTFGAGTSSSGSGPGTFGAGTSASGPGTAMFGSVTTSSGPGIVMFGSGTSSSGPGTVTFGAGTSSSGSGFGVSSFGSGTTFSNPFSSSSASGFSFSSPSSAAASSSLTMASSNVFGSTSASSSASIFGNNYSSSSSAPGVFTFGQPASSGSGFTFASQSAPVFSSQSAPVFSSHSAPVFSFSSVGTGMNSSSPQPSFGGNVGFGMGSPANDQMSVEDSMADDTNQPTVPAPVFGASPFGQPGSSPAAPAFGAPAAQPGGVFQFGNNPGSVPQNPSFPAAGSLEFQGGNFSLGSGGGGGDKSSRRFIRVKKGTKKK